MYVVEDCQRGMGAQERSVVEDSIRLRCQAVLRDDGVDATIASISVFS